MGDVNANNSQYEDSDNNRVLTSEIGSFTELATRQRPQEESEQQDEAMVTTRYEVLPDQEALQLIELQHKLKAQNNIIIRLEEENERLRKALEAYERGSNTTKKRKLDEIAETQNNSHLKEQMENLTVRLSERENELHEAREKLAESEWVDTPTTSIDTTSICRKLESIIKQRMDTIEEKLTCMEKKQVKDTSQATYSETLQDPTNHQPSITSFREIARAAKMEDLEEENQKRIRQNNIIIHGKTERESTPDEASTTTEEDSTFVHALLKELCVGAVKAKSLARIGNKGTEKTRPLKVTFNSESDKLKVMNNLKYLKGKSEFNGVSIKEDFTISERNMIRDYVRQANEKNEIESIESEYVWRVRGSPKNRLFLKKVMKVRPKV